MAISDVGRAASHVLLDAVAVFDPDASEDANNAATALALERLRETGAIRFSVDEASGALNFDISDVVEPAVMLLYALSTVMEGRGFESADFVAMLRTALDQIG